MRTIHKYKLPAGGGEINLPHDAVILSAAFQGNDLNIWVELNTTESVIPRTFEIFGTGHQIVEGMSIERRFVATAFFKEYVFHVYERV